MHVNDLPPSREMAKGADLHTIGMALRAIVGDESFRHIEIVRGAPRSGRILLTEPSEGSVPLSDRMPCFHAAAEFEKLLPEARFDPPSPPKSGATKGWEVREIKIDGTPAALVWSAWV